MFSDVQYMTAKEKEMIFKQWQKFLKGKWDRSLFTKRLYNHLHLHCDFIAHYDIHGFYSTYFSPSAIESTMAFFNHFDITSDNSCLRYCQSDYRDINKAMCDEFDKIKDEIYKGLDAIGFARDITTAKLLLEKHGIDTTELDI